MDRHTMTAYTVLAQHRAVKIGECAPKQDLVLKSSTHATKTHNNFSDLITVGTSTRSSCDDEINTTSTSVFRDGRISTYADPTRGQRTG